MQAQPSSISQQHQPSARRVGDAPCWRPLDLQSYIPLTSGYESERTIRAVAEPPAADTTPDVDSDI